MKVLQNKIFVILLAVFAVGLVGKNLFWPAIKRAFPAKTVAKAAAPAPAAPAPASAQKSLSPAVAEPVRLQEKDSSKPVAPEQRMAVQEMWAMAPQWNETPRRDPFRVIGARTDGKAARDLLMLKGVLRQTQSTLAVLNDQVMSAGDTILGFKIESVEDDRVWVTGPNGREVVEFKHSVPPGGDKPRDTSRETNLSLVHPIAK